MSNHCVLIFLCFFVCLLGVVILWACSVLLSRGGSAGLRVVEVDENPTWHPSNLRKMNEFAYKKQHSKADITILRTYTMNNPSDQSTITSKNLSRVSNNMIKVHARFFNIIVGTFGYHNGSTISSSRYISLFSPCIKRVLTDYSRA